MGNFIFIVYYASLQFCMIFITEPNATVLSQLSGPRSLTLMIIPQETEDVLYSPALTGTVLLYESQ